MAKPNPYHQGPPAHNYDGLRFFNPGEPETDRTLRQLLRWKLAGAAAAWPKQVAVEPAVPDARVRGLRVTMVGHATLLIQAAGLNILTDPVWSARASPLSFAGHAGSPLPESPSTIFRGSTRSSCRTTTTTISTSPRSGGCTTATPL